MDTSKEYIKMCRAAQEIQSLKPPLPSYSTNYEDGDIIVLGVKVFMYDGCSHSEGFIEPQIYNPKCVWLPRQDQLQEMCKEKNIVDLVWNFGIDVFGDNKEVKGKRVFYYDQFTSIEQLWLSFVMKKKYNKTWKDGKWTTQPILN